MNNNTIRLRPHHGLCAAFFKGYGYSEEFSRRMGEILKSPPKTRVILTDGCDDICTACPHKGENGVCDSRDKVRRYDNAVLGLCGLDTGKELSFGEFKGLVSEKIIEKGLLHIVCEDCCWYYICGAENSSNNFETE